MRTCLENVDYPLVLHSLKNTAKCDEYSSSTHSGTEKESQCVRSVTQFEHLSPTCMDCFVSLTRSNVGLQINTK